MKKPPQKVVSTPRTQRRRTDWRKLAERVLDGDRLTAREAQAVLNSPDEDLLDVLAAAYRVRRHWFGDRVSLNFLLNAKSGLCGEDCAYCAQSRVSQAKIARYPLVDAETVWQAAQAAAAHGARTFCSAISGRAPSNAELDKFASLVPEIKSKFDFKVCFSVGLLSLEQARRLKACGVDRINHNLNTSRRFYPQICSTHTYEQRLQTLRNVRRAGLEICSGGIVGMGETPADVVSLALELSRLEVEALPVNFLLPLEGTPLAGCRVLTPRYCLKVLAMFRLTNPRTELRIAAGREVHLGPLQPLSLFAANSMFVGGYLTTRGRPPEEDYQMLDALSFTRAVD